MIRPQLTGHGDRTNDVFDANIMPTVHQQFGRVGGETYDDHCAAHSQVGSSCRDW